MKKCSAIEDVIKNSAPDELIDNVKYIIKYLINNKLYTKAEIKEYLQNMKNNDSIPDSHKELLKSCE